MTTAEHAIAASIATRLNGSVPESLVDSQPAEGGIANEGCFIHKFRGGDGKVLGIVEKRSRSRRELIFSKIAISEDAERPVYPKVYHLQEQGPSFVIFMELLEQTNEEVFGEADFGRKLARGVARIADIRTPRKTLPSPHMVSSARVEEFAAVGRKAGLIDERQDRILAGAAELMPVINDWMMQNLKLSLTHGDIYFPNMVASSNERGEVRFIDWGAFGLNFIGADFHHFIRAAINVRKRTQVDLAGCLAHYAEQLERRGIEVSVREIEIGALYYGLFRTVNRFIARPSGPSVDDAVFLYESLRSKTPM